MVQNPQSAGPGVSVARFRTASGSRTPDSADDVTKYPRGMTCISIDIRVQTTTETGAWGSWENDELSMLNDG